MVATSKYRPSSEFNSQPLDLTKTRNPKGKEGEIHTFEMPSLKSVPTSLTLTPVANRPLLIVSPMPANSPSTTVSVVKVRVIMRGGKIAWSMITLARNLRGTGARSASFSSRDP